MYVCLLYTSEHSLRKFSSSILNWAVLTYPQHNETLCANISTEPSPNRWFHSSNVYIPWTCGCGHQNSAFKFCALQKNPVFDAPAHSEEHKWCGMHIHDQNLNVLFVQLNFSTKNAQVIQHIFEFEICSWHMFRPFKMQIGSHYYVARFLPETKRQMFVRAIIQ